MEIIDVTVKLDLDVEDDALVKYADQSYHIALKAVQIYLDVPDPAIHVWAEQGSLNLKTKVWIPLMAISTSLAQIDGIVGGIEKVYTYSKKAMTYIAQETSAYTEAEVLSIKKSGGLPQKITEVLSKVKAGRLTVDSGTEKILILLENEDGDAQFKDDILRQFRDVAEIAYNPHPEKSVIFRPRNNYSMKDTQSRREVPVKRPVTPSLQGVEIWYDPKTGQRTLKRYQK